MPVLRSSTRRAPASRIYSSAPAQRQKYFTPPAIAPKKHRHTDLAKRKKRQSTLTQLDFVGLGSDSEEEQQQLSAEEDSDSSYSKRQAKRRRISRKSMTEEERRQQTLTQMDGFLVHDSDEEIDLEEDGLSADDTTEDGENQPVDLPTMQQSNHTTHWQASPTRTSPPPHAPFESHLSPTKPPHTPLRTGIKREIPSSQSPAQTPLSIYQTPTSHYLTPPSHYQRPAASQPRTPLAEIHPNILAMRDSLSAGETQGGKPSGKKVPGGASKRKLPAPATASASREKEAPNSDAEDEADAFDSENENFVPSSDELDDNDTYGDPESPTKKRLDYSKAVGRLPRPPTSISQVSRAKRGDAEETMQQGTIRTSQATTVSHVSPASVRRSSPLKHFASPSRGDDDGRSSSPLSARRPLSELQMSIDSQLPAMDMKDVTQLASIYDSADIVRVGDAQYTFSDS